MESNFYSCGGDKYDYYYPIESFHIYTKLALNAF